MTAQQLKNAILQEAIQGRLVPQDHNDEPASVLLDKIRKEKARLVREKLIYKKSETKPLYEEGDYPFDIPVNWKWVQLSDVSIIQEGAGIRKHQYTKKGTQLLCVTNILDGSIDLSKKVLYVSDNEYKEKYMHLTPQKGDIVTACSGGSWGKIAIFDCNEVVMLNTSTLRLRFFNDLANNKYLYYLAQSKFFKDQLACQLVGIQPNFGYAHYSRICFPLPPLAEQQRIVAKIEELLPKVEEYGKAQEKLNKLNEELPEQLKKSILQEAIEGRLVPQDPNDEPASVLLDKIRKEKQQLVKEGMLKKKDLEETPVNEDEKPFIIPDNWEWTTISNIFIVNPKVIAEDAQNAAFIPMEKIEAGYSSSYTFDVRKWGEIKKTFTNFADGDVAFAKITPCFQNMKSVIFQGLPNGVGAGTTELKVLRSIGNTIDRKYLLYFLKSQYFIKEAKFKGTANQQRIVVGYLENKIFPLPPLAEQHRIVAKIEQLFKEIDKLKK